MTYFSLALSDLTSVWRLYFGLFFIAIVMFAPGGITGLLMKHRPLVRAGTLVTVLRAYLVALVPTLTMIAGLILAIEIVVQHTVNAGEGPYMKAFGVHFNAASPLIWLLAVAHARRIYRRAPDLDLGRERLGRGTHRPHVKKDSAHDVAQLSYAGCRRASAIFR